MSHKGDVAGTEGAVSKTMYRGLPSPAGTATTGAATSPHFLGLSRGITVVAPRPQACLLTWLKLDTSFDFQKTQPGGPFELPGAKEAFSETWGLPTASRWCTVTCFRGTHTYLLLYLFGLDALDFCKSFQVFFHR